jgi:hypothetical protein
LSEQFIKSLLNSGITRKQAEIIDNQINNSNIVSAERNFEERDVALRYISIIDNKLAEIKASFEKDIALLNDNTRRKYESITILLRFIIGISIVQLIIIIFR